MAIKVLGVAALALCALGVTAAAPQDDFAKNTDGGSRLCFRNDRVEGFAAARLGNDVDGVNLRVRNDVYQLEFATPCPQIRDATRVAVSSRTPISICTGADVDIIAYSQLLPPARCKASGLRKIAAGDIASIPANERP